MLKLTLQYFGYLMWREDSLEKTLVLEKIEGKKAEGGSWWWIEKPGVLQSLGSQRVGHIWATEQQQIMTVDYTWNSARYRHHEKQYTGVLSASIVIIKYRRLGGFSSVRWLTLCNPMDCSMSGFPVHHQLPELAQTQGHWVSDDIHTSHPLSSPSPPAFNLYQHQGLFQLIRSSHQVVKVIGASTSISVLPINIQDWSSLGLTGLISLQSMGLSRVFCNTTVQKHQFFSSQLFMVQWLLEKP